MKIYIVTTGANAITVSLNGEAAVAKTVKPTLTALGYGKILFVCDDISEEVETYRHIFINGVPLKGSWIAEEDYLSVSLFEAVINKTFTSSPGGSSYLVASVTLTDAQIKASPTPINILAALGTNKAINVVSISALLHLVNFYTNVTGSSFSFDIGDKQVFTMDGGNPLQELAGDWYITGQKNNAVSLYSNGMVNQPLSISFTNAGDLTGGNALNTLKLRIGYTVDDFS